MDRSHKFFLIFILILVLRVSYSHEENVKSYIIHVSEDMKPPLFQNLHDWYLSLLSSVKGYPLLSHSHPSTILYMYGNVLKGFCAPLTPSQARALTNLPGILSASPDVPLKLHTTRSPHFLGLDSRRRHSSSNIWQASIYGKDVIVGLIDTGIWPEHPSFDDTNMGPVPSRWKGGCDPDTGGFSVNSTICNRKIIGARVFYKGYEMAYGPIDESVDYKSPRDSYGHGTHTASTAAGRFVSNVSYFGYAGGVASGVAPDARLAIYKVCFSLSCFESDILAAFDDAIGDGVDVISISLGFHQTYDHYLNPIATGSFAAMQRGILTSASAGNSGPEPYSVSNVAPWLVTVAASTLDRSFPALVVLGDGATYEGISVFFGENRTTEGQQLPLVYGGNVAKRDNASFCEEDTLDPTLVAGKIVVCEIGNISNFEKALFVNRAGGAGAIFVNSKEDGEQLFVGIGYNTTAVDVGYNEGESIKRYMKRSAKPTASITFKGTILDVKPSPMMAQFSSRGPNPLPNERELLKPDITAPGVDILAAYMANTYGIKFVFMSGTSMSCPHIAGVTALLKGIYPNWSPSAIKSALMTTSTFVDNTRGPILDWADGKAATPFDYGAGHVVPEVAMNPGLVYDMDIQNYIDYLCSLNYSRRQMMVLTMGDYNCSQTEAKIGDLNYPSFSVVYIQQSSPTFFARYRRTVLNVGTNNSEYMVHVLPPLGLNVSVEPTLLKFTYVNQKLTYNVTFTASRINSNLPYEASFGSLAWKDGTHVVQSPISFLRSNEK